MTFWIIAGTILIVLTAICFIRIGIIAQYSEAGLEAWVKIGFFRRQIHPAKKDKKPRKVKAEAEKPAESEEKREKGGPIEAFRKYFDLALDLLRYLKRTVRIDTLRVRFVAAAKDDAAKAAILYGKAWAAEGIVMAVLENNIRVAKREIDITVDYRAEKPSIFCYTVLSAPVGGLLAAGLRAIKDLVKIKMKEKGGEYSGKANS